MSDPSTITTWAQILAPVVVGIVGSGVWAWLAQRDRQKFERLLAAELKTSHATLEVVKAQLTFDSEVRKHAAARKVDAILKVAAAAKAAVEEVYSLTSYDAEARAAAERRYYNSVREGLLLFDHDVSDAMLAFGQELASARIELMGREMDRARGLVVDPQDEQSDLQALLKAGEAARDRFLEVLRRELHLEPLKDQSRTPVVR